MLVFIFHSANCEYILNPMLLLLFTVLQRTSLLFFYEFMNLNARTKTSTDYEWVSSGRWVAKLVARLLAKAALWVRISSHLSKIQNGRHKPRSGQRTLARQINIQKRTNDALTGDHVGLIGSLKGRSKRAKI
jgi:hypothetical protein